MRVEREARLEAATFIVGRAMMICREYNFTICYKKFKSSKKYANGMQN